MEVVVEGGKIAAINVLSQDETPVLSDAAFNTIPGAIIEAQSTDVDVVTGATGTSKVSLKLLICIEQIVGRERYGQGEKA